MLSVCMKFMDLQKLKRSGVSTSFDAERLGAALCRSTQSRDPRLSELSIDKGAELVGRCKFDSLHESDFRVAHR